MTTRKTKKPLGVLTFFVVASGLALYFTFAAVQGDYGLFRRAEIEQKTRQLTAELAETNAEIKRMENLTHRLSDGYLDLDLDLDPVWIRGSKISSLGRNKILE